RRSCDRLDPADIGRARGFREHLEEPNLGGRVNVRASAELSRERTVADLDHPHDVAVLLPEQRHRTEAPGLGQRGRHRAHRLALADPSVDLVLDVTELLTREAAAVCEVESELVRADVRTRLMDVATKTAA